VTDFLNQVGEKLDWEAAEKHALANLVVNAQELKLNLEDKSTYCICCHMPFPEEQHFFSVCVDNKMLGCMGPGYPLFFEFMKSIGWLMLILSLINFLPQSYMMYDSYIELKDNLEPEDSIIALFSFGAFVQHVGDSNFEYLQFDKRRGYILASAAIMTFSVVVSLIYLIFMRRSLYSKA